MDVKIAFLNGTLKYEIYFKVPKGLPYCDKNAVCKLNKAIMASKKLKDAGLKFFKMC